MNGKQPSFFIEKDLLFISLLTNCHYFEKCVKLILANRLLNVNLSRFLLVKYNRHSLLVNVRP